jgi:hypothetical protein
LSEVVEDVYPPEGRLPIEGLEPVDGRVDGSDPVEGRVEGCAPVDGRVEGWVPVEGLVPALGTSAFDQPPLSRRSQLPLSLRR